MAALSFDFLQYEQIDSTNEEAKRLLAAGAIKRLTLIRADSQTAGKGTQGRTWISPPGAGLYMTLVHPFHDDVESLGTDWLQPIGSIPLTPLFTLAAGVACAQTIQDLTGLSIQLKPINDLYVEGRKLGGILTESLISQGQCKALITGIGINILTHEAVHPDAEEMDRRNTFPTSLQDCISPALFFQWQGSAILEELSQGLTHQIDRWYRSLTQGNSERILREYMQFKMSEVSLPPELAELIHHR
ncbi:MAG: biotin [acetyl-CoA carboxylase] synthetase [Vampirovibrio sp.]|jgi:biotin-[acetyl-CoA-carboxylase] ligase BirA-like protein|nr:biotin [acetyl-CoA carboxylase] synthetase [Vampirovibrio sp.]